MVLYQGFQPRWVYVLGGLVLLVMNSGGVVLTCGGLSGGYVRSPMHPVDSDVEQLVVSWVARVSVTGQQ